MNILVSTCGYNKVGGWWLMIKQWAIEKYGGNHIIMAALMGSSGVCQVSVHCTYDQFDYIILYCLLVSETRTSVASKSQHHGDVWFENGAAFSFQIIDYSSIKRSLLDAAQHHPSDIEWNKFALGALNRMAVDEQNRQQMVAVRGISMTVVSMRPHPADSYIEGTPRRKWDSNRKKLCSLSERRESSVKNDFDAAS